MLGTWRWNVVFGFIGTVLTVAFSIGNNPVSVTLLRSMYAFIAFFVLAFVMRAVLTYILQPPSIAGEQPEQDEGIGSQLDMLTPDESDDLNQMLKSQLHDGTATTANEAQANAAAAFRPLNPPQLLSSKNTQPEELVKAIRHLTGE